MAHGDLELSEQSADSDQPTARELVEELSRLFEVTDFSLIRDSLEGRLSPAQADELLGPFSRFVRKAVDPEVVIDFSAAPVPADYTKRFSGWQGWLEFWRLWFEPWDQQRSENVLEELDRDRVIQHTITYNQGRGSGATVKWEGYNFWAARNGRLVRLEQFATRAEALQAAKLLE
jgi:hypothetical protein